VLDIFNCSNKLNKLWFQVSQFGISVVADRILLAYSNEWLIN
jgi:hypothetical protein